jgi:hypothetical protein
MNATESTEPRDNTAWAVFGVLAIFLIAGLALEAPGVLIVLLILAVPATIRAAVAYSGAQQEAAGGPSFLLLLLSSLGIAALIGVASFGAFFATCFVVCFGGLALSDKPWGEEWLGCASIGIGSVVGLTMAILLFWLFRIRRQG